MLGILAVVLILQVCCSPNSAFSQTSSTELVVQTGITENPVVARAYSRHTGRHANGRGSPRRNEFQIALRICAPHAGRWLVHELNHELLRPSR
jgi:hypothetical protein